MDVQAGAGMGGSRRITAGRLRSRPAGAVTAPRSTRGAARLYTFVALAVALAAVFVRLGFWQLDRLRERKALNVALKAALAEPAIPFPELQKGSGRLDRRTMVEGTPDY